MRAKENKVRGGVSVQVDIHICARTPRRQCYNTGLQALHPVYSPKKAKASASPYPPTRQLSVQSIIAARCLPSQ